MVLEFYLFSNLKSILHSQTTFTLSHQFHRMTTKLFQLHNNFTKPRQFYKITTKLFLFHNNFTKPRQFYEITTILRSQINFLSHNCYFYPKIHSFK